ncbi:BPSS1780 family membrane protein [Chitinibacter sp. SCUT-21]|uniref:BPSS1780 family membrane protein n=1 Tax=Chitinibacter sp. SCUT-21 TaxID=2970891 RepID=UPI0035A6EEF1
MQEQDEIIDLAIEPRSLPTSSGWQWITRAFALFRQAPTAWVGITGLFVVLMLAINFVPILGGFVGTLLGPVMLGGLMIAAQKTDQGEKPQISDLFAGFKYRTIDLIKVGAYYMLGTMVLLFLLSGIVGALEFLGVIDALPEQITAVDQVKHLWPLGVLILGCFLLVYSAYFYAPALVILANMSATEAMKLSALAFWRNWSPILLMSLLGALILMLLMLPFFLGLLIGLPVALITSYVCYVDVFPPQGEQQ